MNSIRIIFYRQGQGQGLLHFERRWHTFTFHSLIWINVAMLGFVNFVHIKTFCAHCYLLFHTLVSLGRSVLFGSIVEFPVISMCSRPLKMSVFWNVRCSQIACTFFWFFGHFGKIIFKSLLILQRGKEIFFNRFRDPIATIISETNVETLMIMHVKKFNIFLKSVTIKLNVIKCFFR